jgi:imidazolonepropionase-like amidohydrolase
VELLLGTYCGPNLTIPGFTLIDEIQLGVNSGLSSYDLPRSGTFNAAKALNKKKLQGSVAIGKSADLILLVLLLF